MHSPQGRAAYPPDGPDRSGTWHAYLLLCDDGNILFYNTSRIDEIEPGEWPGHVDRALERLMARQSSIGA